MIAPLPVEDWEPLLTMRLVWMDPIGSGEEVWERRAAAAAADDREAVDGDLLRKAALAAIAAEELGGGPRGCGCMIVVSTCHDGACCMSTELTGCELARLRLNKGILTTERLSLN